MGYCLGLLCWVQEEREPSRGAAAVRRDRASVRRDVRRAGAGGAAGRGVGRVG